MITMLAIVILALVLALVLAPLAGRRGIRVDSLDEPAERKLHIKPVVRFCGFKSPCCEIVE